MNKSEPPSIFMCCWNFPPAVGGIEAVAFHLWRELRAAGADVRILARHGSREAVGEEVLSPGNPGLIRYLLFSLREGIRQMRKAKPDLIVCPGIVDAPAAWILSRSFRVPYVLLAHGTDLMREGSVYRKITRGLFRASEGVAANSFSTRNLLLNAGVKAENIQVIPPGVNTDLPPGEGRVPFPDHSGPVIMTVGRVIRRKGIGEFLEQVMPGLLREFPDLLYVVVGGDASDSLAHPEKLLDRLKARAAELNMKHSVVFTGKIPEGELHRCLDRADLLVFPVIPYPGDVEGFGIVVLEGALHGVPAVASRIGGIPDAVEDGVSGLLVEPGDWAGFQREISELLHSDVRRRSLGEAARRRAETDFNWPKTASGYLEFFKRICSHSGAA